MRGTLLQYDIPKGGGLIAAAVDGNKYVFPGTEIKDNLETIGLSIRLTSYQARVGRRLRFSN